MNTIVCVTSTSNVGCTFVDWSIHFLSGLDKSYVLSTNAWQTLSADPVTKTNAHAHTKNQPFGFQQTKSFLEKLKSQNFTNLTSIYALPLLIDQAAKELGITPPLNADSYEKINHYQADDYDHLVKYCLHENVKTIYIANNPHSILYYHEVRALGRLFFEERTATSSAEVVDHLNSLFFDKNKDLWNNDNPLPIWDRREQLALLYRPFDYTHHARFPDGFANPYLRIDCQSLWYNGANTLKKIMHYLEIPIDDTRWNKWLPIYYKWQQLQLELLEFNFNCQHIVNAIVNNWYYEIDLTFEQEVIVLHCLIYQHNMNLKNWELSKFPGNTQELHKLLEPNIHPI